MARRRQRRQSSDTANTKRYEFGSWAEFVAEAQKPAIWEGEDVARLGAHRPAIEWVGGCSWDDAVRLALYGWPEGREKLTDAIAVMRPERTLAMSTMRDVAGDYPLIPAAVAGDPMNMMVRRPSMVAARPVVRIDVDACYPGSLAPQCVVNRGAALLSVIDAVENRGYSCELRLIKSASPMNRAKIEFSVVYKRAGGPLDLDQAAFVLLHPAVLRRFYFALCEQHPVKEEYAFGYAYVHNVPWNDEPGSIYIGPPCEEDATPENARRRMETLFSSYLDQ